MACGGALGDGRRAPAAAHAARGASRQPARRARGGQGARGDVDSPLGTWGPRCSLWLPRRAASCVMPCPSRSQCGMTMEWDSDGRMVPLTVLWFDGCQVVQVRTPSRDGYAAVQVGAGAKRTRRMRRALLHHFRAHGVPPKARLKEFRVTPVSPGKLRGEAERSLRGVDHAVPGIARLGMRGAPRACRASRQDPSAFAGCAPAPGDAPLRGPLPRRAVRGGAGHDNREGVPGGDEAPRVQGPARIARRVGRAPQHRVHRAAQGPLAHLPRQAHAGAHGRRHAHG